MALTRDGVVSYAGAVIETWERYWLDGMLSEYALVWNLEKHEYETVDIGYYGSDCHDFIGIKAEVEVSTEVARDIIRTLKTRARESFCKSVQAKKEKIEPGIKVIVVKGRKIPKGTKLEVFWIGEKPTYTGYGTELLAGCKDGTGNKIWIKAEYLKNITPLKSPTASERKKYLKWYVKENAGDMVIQAAKGEEKFVGEAKRA